MKSALDAVLHRRPASHPARGGWIEIVRGMEFLLAQIRPTPHGVGGLKSKGLDGLGKVNPSHPARGGWIEIHGVLHHVGARESHPARGGWIEIPTK